MIRVLLALFCLLTSIVVSAQTLPQQAAIPGGVVIVPLNVVSDSRPVVSYKKRQVMVIKQDQQWLAVVGIPLSAKIGTQKITVKSGDETSTALFEIEDKAYPTQNITITDKLKVNPNTYDIDRINAERA